jgi:hypothetical protein
MKLNAYYQFTDQLAENLKKDDNVLGFVAVGSMAGQDYQPDNWSDHDFFVVTRPGLQSHYRQTYDWLPDSEKITWAFRETEHGVKVIYRDGHLLEFAVFDEEELKMARTNRYRVLFDRAQISTQMAENVQKTSDTLATKTDIYHAGQFLSNVLVGMGRYWRGEKLSAHKFIKINAVHYLATLLNQYTQSPQRALVDNLDPTRRFEFVHPYLGPEFEKVMLLSIPEAAQNLIKIFERELPTVITKVPVETIQIIEKQTHFPGKSKGSD